MLLANLAELVGEVVDDLLVARLFLGHGPEPGYEQSIRIPWDQRRLPHKLIKSNERLVDVGIGVVGGVVEVKALANLRELAHGFR